MIDTCSYVWLDEGDESRFAQRARELLLSPDTRLVLSTASIWELAIKFSIGKLKLRISLEHSIREKVATGALSILHIAESHALRVAHLPLIHRDPFDRMLVAQSMIEELPVISPDRALDRYGVSRIWD
jgi:PIN domain nuclease of toxin-antitoxin system